jgi:hypothetical protein
VGGARDAQLLEPAAEGVGVQAEDLGRAARPIDDPTGLPEDQQDMAALDGFERREGIMDPENWTTG